MSLKIGEQAPEFTSPGSNGENVKLSDFRGKNIVLYFYPKDMTPGCTTEACDFRDHHEQFSNLNTVIIGVSPDSLERHEHFIEKHGLPFVLLADENNEVAKLYGVWQLKKTFGREYMGIVRSTFVIDSEGKLIKEWRNVRVKNHVANALQFVEDNLS